MYKSQRQEKETQVSLMNTHRKILNKILANQIQQHIKKFIRQDKVKFIAECKGSLIPENQLMAYTIQTKRTKTIQSSQKTQKKHLTKSNTFVMKTLNKLGIKRNFLNQIKGSYEKPTANITANGERLNACFLLR